MGNDFGTYLDRYKLALGLESDYALAQKLGKSRQYVSQVRKAGHAPDELCLEIAKTIGVEDYIVLAARNAAKETGPVGEAWKKLLAKVALLVITFAAALLLRDYDMGEGEILLSFQALTSLKDYRNFVDLLSIQVLTLVAGIMMPVIAEIGRCILTHCNAQQAHSH